MTETVKTEKLRLATVWLDGCSGCHMSLLDTDERLLELAQKVSAQTGSQSKIIYMPLPADDPKQRQPDITMARQVLGWEPAVQLEEGLKRTIAYFKTRL